MRVARGAFEQTEIDINDQVDISVPELMIVSGAAIVYLLPLFSMLAVMIGAEALFATEAAAALGALLGLVLGVVLVRIHALWLAGKPQYQPVVSSHTKSQINDQVQAVQIA